MKNSQFAIGIDFGTTKSILSYIQRTTNTNTPPHYATFINDGHLVPTPSDTPFYRYGTQFVPTVLAIDKTSVDMASPRVISGFRALFRDGKGFENLELVNDLKERAAKQNHERYIRVNDFEYPIEGLIAHFLATLRKNTKELEGIPIDSNGVTITVPAKAGIVQRMTTQFAAHIAGFSQPIDLLEEPVAAFIYHRHLRPDYFETERNKPNYALVIDFGGGTCDLTVVQYESKKLPRVVGRAMARFGGNSIDDLFLKKFWLATNNFQKTDMVMSLSKFEDADSSIQALLLAHARQTKEFLSNNPSPYTSHAQDITGVIPDRFGQLITPRIAYNDFSDMLESERFSVDYADIRDQREDSLKGHLEFLLSSVLDDAGLGRSAITKLILAGGSTRLPNIRKWTLGFLSEHIGKGPSNRHIDERHIHDQDAEVCVAGGAAIHQLYRHHKNRAFRKVIQPTLSSSFWLIHYNDGIEADKIELAAQNENLPIKRDSYRRAKVIPTVKRWKDGKYRFVLVQGENSSIHIPDWHVEYELPDGFIVRTGIGKLWQAVLITYFIDEFGILQRITWTPGALFRGWRKRHTIEEYGVFEKQKLDVDLKTLSLLSTNERISDLRNQFIPKNLQF